jgi:cell division protein FtsW (lipid II flippase)
VIVLGAVLLIIGFVTGIPIVWTIAMIVLVVGLVLWLLGAMGHAVGGRKHYYCVSASPVQSAGHGRSCSNFMNIASAKKRLVTFFSSRLSPQSLMAPVGPRRELT